MSSVHSDSEESDNETGNEPHESVSLPREKYSLRSPVQNRLFKDDVVLEDSGKDSDSEDGNNQSILSECAPALKTYFYDRLLQVVLFLGGTVDDTQGWRVQVTKKDGGLTMGILEVEYINSYNRKFKSRVEVACFLGLMPTVRNIRSMSRDQHFINAIEVREIHLISQLLAVVGFRCSEFQYTSDVITLKYINEEGELVPAISLDPVTGERLHFSFGNCTILNWGKIVQDVNFHSSTQIYPVGFKCLRQEHDVKLDRIVDCLCEIDSVPEPQPVGEGNNSNSEGKPKKPSMLPVFRITVSWELLDGSKAVRVYEARTPQQAWQAVMLERLGTKEHTPSNGSNGSNPNGDNTTTCEYEGDFEQPDAEELRLRAEIREQRRLYFRALRGEQSAGNQAAMKPRLALDAVDSFGEDLILRMIEGMEGSFKCVHYQFLDSREKEAGKKNMLRAYSKIFVKAKNLDKVIGRTSGGAGRKRVRVDDSLLSGAAGGATAGGGAGAKKLKGGGNESNKQLRALSQAFMKNRTAKIRELEKGVTILKAAMIRNIKRRRDDAKLFVEAVCEREELTKAAATAGGNDGVVLSASGGMHCADAVSEELLRELKQFLRPEAATASAAVTGCGSSSSTTAKHLMDGEVFGQVLEIWEFLNIFAKPLKLVPDSSASSASLHSTASTVGVPSIDVLLQTMKALDPAYRTVHQYARGVEHTFEGVSQSPSCDFESSTSLLNSLGITLTTPLLKDFERLFGVDQVEAQIGDVRVPVNELTWREVARVALLQSACRDVGMGDADIASLIKGRGFYTTPESADRKNLKLARRRILCNFSIRDEFQESLFGFHSGHVVRIPAPAAPLYPHDIVWSDLIRSLHQVSDASGWLVHEIIQTAALAACAVDRSPAAKKLRKALMDCLSGDIFRVSDGGSSKQAALSLLQSAFFLGLPGSDPPLITTSSSACSAGNDRLKLVYDFSPYIVPHSSLDVWAKQVREGVRCARSEYADSLLLTADGELLQQGDEEGLMLVEDTKEEDEDSEDEEEEVAAAAEPVVTEVEVIATAADVVTTATEGGVMEGGLLDLSQESGEVVTAKLAVKAVTATEPDSIESSAASKPSDPSHQSLADTEWREPDSVDAEKLSIAMQRCYLVMRDLMSYSHAKHFLLPVDVRDVPLYYKFTSQPLSLSEIRSHLVSGGYNDSLFAFYSDINLLIENALSFNLEGSPAKAAAIKLQAIFERLFFETVLSWDHPLPFHDSCHFCRSGYPVPANKGAVCDRCESSYHLHCLDLTCPPRSEWYCFPCVEQRSIANAHPYKTADVRHPSDPEAVGEVVGIEQIKQTLMFVVAFGEVREMWTPKKVREFAVDRSLLDELLAAGGPIEGSSDTVAKTRVRLTPPPLVIPLPSGYNIEDYDHVCGLARGYSGWSGSHCLVPSVLLDSHSAVARQCAKLDVLLDKTRKAVGALGAGGQSPDDASAGEWTIILRSLLQKLLTSLPALSAALSQLEDTAADEHLVHRMLECIGNNDLSLARLSQFLKEASRKAAKSPRAGGEGAVAAAAGGAKKGRKPGAGTVAGKTAAADAESVSDEEASDSESSSSGSEDGNSDSSSLYSEDAEFDEPLPTAGQKTPTSAKTPAATSDYVNELVNDSTTSSDDEDDLDFFDEQGNCLTSGSRPPKVDPRVLEEQWEVRQLSRQKGREDALLTEVLVWDILNELDVDGMAESAEEGFSLVQQDLGPFYKAAVNAIVKSCIGKPSESLVVEDWVVGWDTRMATLLKRKQNPSASADELVCPLCGCEEGFLGSPFVRGMSRSEYEAFIQPSIETASSDALEIADPTAVALSRARQPASRASIQALLTPGSISANTGIKGFRARNKALNGLVWMPYDEDDAAIEAAECALINRPMVSGSLVVHECCADFMHFNRQLSEGRYQSSEDKRVVEILLGLGRGKTTPLGSDRFGDLYWVFLGSTCLFVSGCRRSDIGGAGVRSETNSDDAGSVMDVVKSDEPAVPFTDSGSGNTSSSWYCYESVQDISRVVRWLDERIPSEKLVKRVLSLLFPQSVSLPAAAMPTASSSASATELASNEVSVDGEAARGAMDVTTVSPTAAAYLPDNTTGINSDAAASEDNNDDACSESSDGSVNEEDEAEEQEEEDDGEEAEFDDAYEVDRGSASIAESKPKRELKAITESVQQSVAATVRGSSVPAALFRRGDQVLVESSSANHILWEAKVTDVRADPQNGENYYKVHFHQWSSAYDGWYSGDCLTPLGKSREGAKLQIQRSKNRFLNEKVYQAPPLLQTLLAHHYMSESKRAAGPYRPPLTYSDAHSTLGALRSALLMIEAALPVGAIDESEDRWADQFVVPWRHAVCASGDATSLMQCQIMLEYGIKTAWLKPTGLKYFSCMPSRTMSMRNATCGMVAIRIWLLDQTIKYDKVLEEEKGSNRGRPPKKESSAVIAATALNTGVSSSSKEDKGGVSKAGRPKVKKVIRDD